MLSLLLGALLLAALIVLLLNLQTGERRLQVTISHCYPIHSQQFLRTLNNLMGPPIVGGNSIRTLVNGEQIFPAMLEAIRGARQTITFETFIYWSGDIGREFADALSERARAGIKVHVLLDWLGSVKMEESLLEAMREAGVEIYKYHSLKWYHLNRMNNRTHRKILVIDGTVGFTGGVGISDKWQGHAQDADHWRDTHYEIRGPVVAQLQSAFLDNWMKVSGCVLHSDQYFPSLPEVGPSYAQVFKSDREGGSESMHLMYLLTIGCAQRSILLATAYFVPDRLAVKALVEAAQRGVKIKIILPGRHIDTLLVRHASRAMWGELLQAGIEIHEYQHTMFHCKALIVDDFFVSVGSTNFDSRSFRLNAEANLNVVDEDFARVQSKLFHGDLEHCRPILLAEWRRRPVVRQCLDNLALLLKHQL